MPKRSISTTKLPIFYLLTLTKVTHMQHYCFLQVTRHESWNMHGTYGTHQKSVRKVSNGGEITFEVLRGVREMYM